ncbi:MAG: hypothetical protein A2W37_05115 [Chloroflexi bacterium RBG_16_63_12]|nr:MAG: hypothetical protein A2W37_05115 [Chloroflexi bacterium RBG_16_63_12]
MTLTKRHRFVFSAGVLLIAAGLRLWHISQTPPGLYLDEAFHLLQAQEIARGEALPVFIIGNNGYEPLFVYLAVIPLKILGPVAWAGRLVAAWAGLIGVALTMRAGRELFPGRSVGMLAGLVLATLVWNLAFSRFGSQPILAVPTAAGTLAGLWLGARTGNRKSFALAGVSLGLGLDAYLGFRLFPAIPLAAGLALLAARPEKRRELATGGLLAAAVAALIFAPLALFFIRNPHWFFNRFGQTTAETLGAGNSGAALAANSIKTIGGLFVQGDSNWRHNLAGRPALDVAQAFFFLTGTGVCLRQWRRPETWTLLVWLIVGLSPSMLTFQAPHFGRAIMATPAIAILAAMGIENTWKWARSRAAHMLIAIAVILSTALTVNVFFGQWASDPHLFEFFEVQQTRIARALKTAPADSALYATPLHIGYYHDLWPIEFFLGREAYGRFGAFNGQACSVLPAHVTAGATYAVIAPDDLNTPAVLAAAFSGVTHRTIDSLAGTPDLDAYQIPAGRTAQIQVATPRRIDFGNLVRMVGYTWTAAPPRPGDVVQLKVVWETKQTTPIDYKVFVHLIGPPKADGTIIYTQRDARPCADTYPTRQWHPGELVIDTYSLALPADLPSGDYLLKIGWYAGEGGAGSRLSAFDEAGQFLGDSVLLETVRISAP